MLFYLIGSVLQQINYKKVNHENNKTLDNGIIKTLKRKSIDFILEHNAINQYSERHVVASHTIIFFGPVTSL
jgi:hypothetical protein